MRISNKGMTLVTLAGLIVAVAVTALATTSLSSQPCNTTARTHIFTLVSTLNGYNDSGSRPDQEWPVIKVTRCDNVILRLVNQDPSQAHGLAVAYYSNGGILAGPGQTVTVSFQVNRAGQFKVYCSILCSVHRTMQNGILNVS